MRIQNIEFRNIENRFPEIICWCGSDPNKKYCYTIASWKRGSEGYNLEFIGDRPFKDDEIDPADVWALMKYAQKILNASFELEEYRNEKGI